MTSNPSIYPPKTTALLSALLKNAFMTTHCSSPTIHNQMSSNSWLQFILWHGSARFPSCTRSCIAINRPGVKLQLWLELDCYKMAIPFMSDTLLFSPCLFIHVNCRVTVQASLSSINSLLRTCRKTDCKVSLHLRQVEMYLQACSLT